MSKKCCLLFFYLLFCCFSIALAQTERPKPTPNISQKSELETAKKPQNERVRKTLYIVKSTPKGTLTGNRCAEEVTLKMGFEYVIAPKGTSGNKTGFQRVMHNSGVKTALFFRNGPFWQCRLKRRLKECRIKTAEQTF